MPPTGRQPAAPVSYDVAPNLRVDELTRKLTDIFKNLREVESGDASHQVSKKLADHFAQQEFLQHSDKHVRALIAACLAELFRIFVGTTDDEMSSQGVPAQIGPLSDVNLLKAVFEFFIEQLNQFLPRNSPHYTLAYHVTQVMATTKAFTLIFNLDDHQSMLEDMMQMFFHVIGEKHTAVDRMAFLEIMVGTLSDAEVVISHAILKTMLHPLTPDAKRQRPAAYTLAKELLKRIPKEIEPCIGSYFIHLVTFENAAEAGDLRDNLSTVILELFNISPQLVSSSLRHVESQAGSATLKDRLEALLLIAELYASDRFPEVSGADKDLLFRLASGRLKDIEEKIRVQAIKVAKVYICNRKDFEDKERIKDYIELLGQTLMDHNTHVRAEALTTISAICLSALDLMPGPVLEELGDRILDKERAVRDAAVTAICHMFDKIMYQNLNAGSVEKVRSKIGPLLPQLFANIKHLPERNIIEHKIHLKLLPLRATDQALANHLIYFYACCDDRGVSFFEDVLKRGMKARELLIGILSGDDDAAKKRHRVNLGKLFPELNSGLDELVERLQNDRQFAGLVRNYTTLEIPNLAGSVEDFLKYCDKSNAAQSTASRLFEVVVPFRLTTRLCGVLQATLIDILNDHLTQTEFLCHSCALPVQPELLRRRSARLIQLISKHLPSGFAPRSSLERMLKFWRDRDTEVAVNIHYFFSNVATTVRSNPSNTKIAGDILEKAMELTGQTLSTPMEAKYDARVVSRIVKNYLESFGTILAWARGILEDTDDLEDISRAVAVVALGEMARSTGQLSIGQRSDSVLEHTFENTAEVSQFQKELIAVFEKVVLPQLRFDKLEPASESEEDVWCGRDQLSGSVRFVIYAMKAAGKFCRAYRNILPRKDSARFPVLVRKFVDKLKDCCSDGSRHIQDLDVVSQEHIFITAGIQLMRIVPEFPQETPTDLNAVFDIIPQLSHSESQQKFIRFILQAAIVQEDSGIFLALASSAALHPDPDTLGFRDVVQLPLVTVMQHLRNRVAKYGQRQELCQPELSVAYLFHMLVFSKDFKDPDRVAECTPFLEKQAGPAIFCLLDALVSDNPQFAPGIIHSTLRLAKHSHVLDKGKNKNADPKLYLLCDFALALLEKRSPQGAKQESALTAKIPSQLFAIDDKMYEEEPTVYFRTPVTVSRRGDGTVRIYITGNQSHGVSESRDSDGHSQKNGKSRRSKRSRTGGARSTSGRSADLSVSAEPSEQGDDMEE